MGERPEQHHVVELRQVAPSAYQFKLGWRNRIRALLGQQVELSADQVKPVREIPFRAGYEGGGGGEYFSGSWKAPEGATSVSFEVVGPGGDGGEAPYQVPFE